MRTLMKSIVTGALVVVLGGPALAAAGPRPVVERPVAAEKVATPTRAPAKDSDAARYAEREKQSQSLETFKGGAGLNIYIGGTALAVAALIVLVLVLL
jgi:hypothetical protein